MSSTYDALIIGTGVIGNAVAFELAKAGWRTLSLDRNARVGHGSTAGSCAIIRTHYSTLDGTALAFEGYHYWRDWQEYLGLPPQEPLARFREIGCLVMKTEVNGRLQKHMAYSRELGCPFEEWTAAEVERRLPITRLDSFGPPKRGNDPRFGESNGGRLDGAVLWPKAGYVTDPSLAARNLADAAEQHGAAFRTRAKVVSILRSHGRVGGVALAGGEVVHCPVVVNVAGPGSSKINVMADVTADMSIETRALRQEVAHVPAPAGYDFENLGMVLSDSDIACYSRPEHGNHILVGSEDPPCDEHHWVDDEESFDRSFSEQWTTQVMRQAQRMPTLGVPNQTAGVVDLYDASTDWIPIYDKSSLPGFYMACGTSGNQFKNAPIAGKLMASLIAYCEEGNDHDQTPLQFTLPYLQRNVDVGFYSRRRSVNRDSSFSVLG